MDTKLLNKYLAGDALPEEKREVVRWMKESEEHREQLMQMRHIYDATISVSYTHLTLPTILRV